MANLNSRYRALALILGALLILGLGILSQRQSAPVVAPMTLNVALPMMWAQVPPQDWRNLDPRPNPPAVRFAGIVAAYGYIPLIFLIWSIPLFKGDYRLRRRSLVAFPLVLALSSIWVVGAGRAALPIVGATPILTFIVVDLVAWGAVLSLLWRARRTASFASAILLNVVFFGWFAWAAFPWLGEVP